jgi:endonuclease YncB( thermonuclease family)
MFRKLTFLFAAIHLLAICAFAQNGLAGHVVEVMDGRTLVIETSAGRMTAQLQYVETPESDQPFHKIAKDHLAKLTVGRSVEFRTERIVSGKAIGRMTLDGVDLSVQMIRDGAAWHEPAATSGQNPIEAADYAENQRLAKSEKRGVWALGNLKTPWEIRAERKNSALQDEAARRIAHPTLVGVGEFQSDTRRPSGNHLPPKSMSARQQMDAWVGFFATSESAGYGIHTFNDPQGRYGVVYTSPVLLDFVSKTGAKEKFECRGLFVTFNGSVRGRDGYYVLGFRAIADDYRFSRTRPRLTLAVDGKNVPLGVPFGRRARGAMGAEEIFYYMTTWATMKKIAAAKTLDFRVAGMSASIGANHRALFERLTTATQ